MPDATSRAIISQGKTVSLSGVHHVAHEIVVHGTLHVPERGLIDLAQVGFESPVQPPHAFKQAAGPNTGSLVGSDWEFTGGAGITRNTSVF